MSFSIARNDLLEGLSKIVGIAEKKTSLPILSNVMLESDGNMLTLTVSNSDIELEVKVPLSHPVEAFRTTLPKSKLYSLVKSLSNKEDLNFLIEVNRCTLVQNKSNFKFSTLPAEDFPLISVSEPELKLSIQKETLQELIKQVSSSVAKDEVRPFLNGILFDFRTKELRLVATDGHRLSTSKASIQTEDETSKQVIVAYKSVLELDKIAAGSPDNSFLDFEISKNYLVIKKPGVKFVTRLIEGNFPNYQTVIPKNNSAIFSVNKELFESALERSTIVIKSSSIPSDKYHSVKFQIEGSNLIIETRNAENDEAHEELPISYNSDALIIGFNVTYITDIIKVQNQESFSMALRDSSSSALISYSVDDIEVSHVVMPLKI